MSASLSRIRYLRLRLMALLVVAMITALVPSPSFAAMLQANPTRPSAQADEAEWLVMLYSVADDNVLEQDILLDFQEAELIGSTDDVHIVAQVDRYDGGYDGMGDWTSAKRFYVTQDDDMSEIGSEELEDLGEVNMADAGTLLDFIVWAVTNYPARKTMLIMSDHGSGWPGGFGDPDPGGLGEHDVALAEAYGDSLWLMELDAAFELALEEVGIGQFDVVGFDACLMGQLEVFTMLAPYAHYAVASEELEPGVGWAYAAFLDQLTQEPEMEGDVLASAIVETYIQEDMRMLDPEFSKGYSTDEIIEALAQESTLAAIDLAAIADVNVALDAFTTSLTWIDQDEVASARAYAQAYDSIFGEDLPSPYIDLGSFVQILQNNLDDEDILGAAETLNTALDAAIVAEKHGSSRAGSTGIAIYFPVRELYEIARNFDYDIVAERFVTETQWDEFLAFHAGTDTPAQFDRPTPALAATLQELIPELTEEDAEVLAGEIEFMIEEGYSEDEIFDILIDEYELPEDVVQLLADNGVLASDEGGEITLPANVITDKPIELSPVTLSAEVAQPGDPVTIATEVYGSRISYLYTFIGRYLPRDDVLVIEDIDFLYADEEESVDGVTYPIWPEDGFEVSFDWEPIVYAISDGETSIRTLFSPDSYGESPTYMVEGTYHFVDGSPDRYAQLFFRDGELFQVFGFTGAASISGGAPREIYPEVGDQFTVFEQGYNLSEDAEEEDYYAESGTLTFGDELFYLEETPAPSGNYIVGFIAEDIDGEQYEQYEDIFVVDDESEPVDGFVSLVNEENAFALLYPEEWSLEADAPEGEATTLFNDDGSVVTIITPLSYPEIDDPAEADLTAIQEIVDSYSEWGDIENLEFSEEVDAYWLGVFEATWLDFSYELDGQSYVGSLVAATPDVGMTYVVELVATAEEYEDALYDFDLLLSSFDVLISGIEQGAIGGEQPELSEELFYDDYTDPASGLYDELEGDWGVGYYDTEGEQYVYELNPASGAIYDYYLDAVLPDTFILQASALYAGSIDTAYGLLFQVVDDDHFYAFRVSGDGYFLVEKADGEWLDTLVEWTSAEPLVAAEDEFNTLAVVGIEGTYWLYINGVQVGEFSDDSYTEGSAGYMVENFDQEEAVLFAFDDFSVGVPLE